MAGSIHGLPWAGGPVATGCDLSRIAVRGPGRLQAKLRLGSPGDIYEQEADRVADAVMQGHAMPRIIAMAGVSRPLLSTAAALRENGAREVIRNDDDQEDQEVVAAMGEAANPCGCDGACGCDRTGRVQAKAAAPRGGEGGGVAGQYLEPAIGAGIEALRGAGHPLAPTERQFMESRFATDFSGIRIHTGRQSDAYNRALDARAFTLGGDIFFRAAEYAPGRSISRHLLAHELTHAVQQGAARRAPGNMRDIDIRGVVQPAVQRDLAMPLPDLVGGAPILTKAQIAEAVEYNSTRFKDPKALENIRRIVGISPKPAVSDGKLALAIARWQRRHLMPPDGKAHDLTVSAILDVLKAGGDTLSEGNANNSGAGATASGPKAKRRKPLDGSKSEFTIGTMAGASNDEQPSPALKLLLDVYGDKPAGRGTMEFLEIIHDLDPAKDGPGVWGLTSHHVPVIDISVFASGKLWKCVVTTAKEEQHQGVRIRSGAVELTSSMVAAETDCARLQKMITDLDDHVTKDTQYYMIDAVQAHEDVHLAQYRAGLEPHYTALVKAIEALNVPLADYNSASEAKEAIQDMFPYKLAMKQFRLQHRISGEATAEHRIQADFDAAVHVVFDPMIARIRARLVALKCPQK